MLSNKICKKILLCVGALFCALFPIDEAEASSLWDAASTFLKGLKLPETVWQELSDSIKTAESIEEVIDVPGRGVYSFVGVVDSDYCGLKDEYRLLLHNFTSQVVTVNKGERLAQAVLIPQLTMSFQEVNTLTAPSRGGFGSSG